jgi:hypothetical protein
MPPNSLLPTDLPTPCSMTLADASAWYRSAIPEIPARLTPGPERERLDEAWGIKSRLRLTAALSLFDQELVDDFLRNFPLPSIDELLALSPNNGQQSRELSALQLIVQVSEAEAGAFPGTVDVGMTIHNVEGKSFSLTDDGWKEQEPVVFHHPLLPIPAFIRSAKVHPTSSAWAGAPEMGPPESAAGSLAILVASDKLWISYPSDQDGRMSVVSFDGHVEHQLSCIDPETLKNHPYASAGLKPCAFNELSQSLQTIYWAPLGVRHWVVSLWSSTLDVVARGVSVSSKGVQSSSPQEALLSIVSGKDAT